jgi:uncharacterized protein
MSKRLLSGTGRGLELRIAEPAALASGTKLVGYAAKYDVESRVLADWFDGEFVEIIRSGAFDATFASNEDVRFFAHHDRQGILGRRSSGTLRLSSDRVGLRYELDLPDTSLGRDIRELVKRGDLSEMSFGFHVVEERWQKKSRPPRRELLSVALDEISIVVDAAYPSTEASLRDARETDLRRDRLRRRSLALRSLSLGTMPCRP